MALAPSRVVPLAGIRKVAAARMRESLGRAAQLTLLREVDVAALVGHREGRDARPSVTAYLARALALALREHRVLNSRLEGEAILEFDEVNLAVAVAVPDGLVAPVVRGADGLSLERVHLAIRDLAERARARKLTLRDFEDATCSLTNLGAHGVDGFTPILNPPQSAILGAGRIRPAVVLDGGVARERPRLALSLTFDHQVADGVQAARLLDGVARRLASPGEL